MFSASRIPRLGLALLFISGLVCTSGCTAQAETLNHGDRTAAEAAPHPLFGTQAHDGVLTHALPLGGSRQSARGGH